jgi:hypothetical protein
MLKDSAISAHPIKSMTTSAPLQNPGQTWRRTKGILIASAILGLVGTNIATLMSEDAHTVAYGALSSVLHALPLAEPVLLSLLSKSPSSVRAMDVQIATATLTKKLDDLRHAHDAEVKRSVNLERNLNAAVQLHRNLEREHLNLRQSHLMLDNEHKALQVENKAHIKKSFDQASAAKSISTRLATRSAANAARNLSSVPAETIPIVGTAIVLGVTFWDLKDACATLKDLNELNKAFDHQPVNHTEVCGMEVPTQDEALSKIKGDWRSIYDKAAESLWLVGRPPQLSLSEVKKWICSPFGSITGLCP